jgi:hypothetical protein
MSSQNMKLLNFLIMGAIGLGVWGKLHKKGGGGDEGTGDTPFQNSGTVSITFTDAADLLDKLGRVKSAAQVDFRSEGIPCASDAATKAAYQARMEREMAAAKPRIAAELMRIQGIRTLPQE